MWYLVVGLIIFTTIQVIHARHRAIHRAVLGHQFKASECLAELVLYGLLWPFGIVAFVVHWDWKRRRRFRKPGA